jgi:transcriptional regulator with XRE-family HTH domain
MTPAQLRMARALLQLGIRELAEKASVDKMSVQRIESGRRAHPPTMAKIKAALIEEGIIFLGAVEPLYTETVALRWDRRSSSADEESPLDDDEADQPDQDREARPWDEADTQIGPDHIAALRGQWSDARRWDGLSAASRKALRKRLDELPTDHGH